jgi:penicillin-binding protein 2
MCCGVVLRAVVDSGTGTALNVESLPPVSGKSGTSEDMGDGSGYRGLEPTGLLKIPKLWWWSFGERSGGGGGSFAAPLARQVLEAHFQQKAKDQVRGAEN